MHNTQYGSAYTSHRATDLLPEERDALAAAKARGEDCIYVAPREADYDWMQTAYACADRAEVPELAFGNLRPLGQLRPRGPSLLPLVRIGSDGVRTVWLENAGTVFQLALQGRILAWP
jgi:hypothetical protein